MKPSAVIKSCFTWIDRFLATHFGFNLNHISRKRRFFAFQLKRLLTFHFSINVTEIWNQSHEHLTPLENKLGGPADELVFCPLCHQKKCLRIQAHVRLGIAYWSRNRCLLYCFSCHSYTIPVHELLISSVTCLLRGIVSGHLTAPFMNNLLPTLVDARLWSSAAAVLDLEPSTKCNFRCWYCVGRHMEQADITYDNFVRIIDHSPTVRILGLSGEGEPLLHKQFFEMVAYAKKKGIKIFITSNGSQFTQSMVERICHSGVDYVVISIDSSEPAHFEESRIGGNLGKIWDGIERLVAFRNQKKLNKPIIAIRGTVLTHTQHEIPEILREAKKRGVDMVFGFQSLNPKTSYVQIYPEEKRDHLKGILQVSRSIDTALLQSDLPYMPADDLISQVVSDAAIGVQHNKFRQNCDIPIVYSLLSGDVTPCCQIKSPVTQAWNLIHHSLHAVLENPDYENMRFNLWNGIFLPDCDGCSVTGTSSSSTR